MRKKLSKGGANMANKDFALNDIVEMKKQHPCGENRWKIIRMGADIRIKCMGCDRSVMIQRNEFNTYVSTHTNDFPTILTTRMLFFHFYYIIQCKIFIDHVCSSLTQLFPHSY